jgi:acyl-CoA synthetase (AMP-forming)/AMP-acid ligase II
MLNLNQSANLVEVFEKITSLFENKIAYRFLLTDNDADEVNYLDFYTKVCSVANFLEQQFKLKPMDRVIILYPPGLNYLYSFYGCLFAGIIPVPAYPPDYRNIDRITAIVKDCQPALILASSQIEQQLQTLFNSNNGCQFFKGQIVSIPEDQLNAKSSYHVPNLQKDSIAFLQYTSGSTASPKGVVISHGNLLSNSNAIALAVGSTAQTEMVSWLPPYHDMGLIGSIIHPFTMGMTTTLMSPMFFIKRPARWLKAISNKTIGNHVLSPAPNFGYQLCVDKINTDDIAGINLTKWKLAPCGAEPIRIDTYEKFCDKFGVNGFKRESFIPVYGLAEATLMLSGGITAQAPQVLNFNSMLIQDRLAVPVVEGDNSQFSPVTPLMGCGQVVTNHTILIVDPATRSVCNDNEIGEIWVSGSSVARKYWGNKADHNDVFQAYTSDGRGPFFRTGDMGFFINGELFISGRLKDCLIINGRNHFPQDIENTISNTNPVLRQDCTAVFMIDNQLREVVIAVQEVARDRYEKEYFDQIFIDVRKAVFQKHQLAIEHIVLINQASIPKTSSGKIQRSQTKKLFIENKLDVLAMS